MDVPDLNIEFYRKYLQSMYRAIKDINPIVLIIKYKLEKREGEVIEFNKSKVLVLVKNTLLNYTESIPKYL